MMPRIRAAVSAYNTARRGLHPPSCPVLFQLGSAAKAILPKNPNVIEVLWFAAQGFHLD
jgi:hypothetical protein